MSIRIKDDNNLRCPNSNNTYNKISILALFTEGYNWSSRPFVSFYYTQDGETRIGRQEKVVISHVPKRAESFVIDTTKIFNWQKVHCYSTRVRFKI